MSSLLKEVRDRVLSPGPCVSWKHEASNQAKFPLENLESSAVAVQAQCQDLRIPVSLGQREQTRLIAFAILQNLYPIVEAIDTDAGQYLAQATEALRKVGADV